MRPKEKILVLVLFMFSFIILEAASFGGTIDVMIKGIDDGVKTNRQQDYKEAVMDAKLEAIERAGVEVQSITQVVNFQTKFDIVESRARAVLLPGFKIIDIGYLGDGTYQVVLVGKVKGVEEAIETKDLRYAENLIKRGEKSKAGKIVGDIIMNSKNDSAVAEALYYSVLWSLADNERETLEKLKAYYPGFKNLERLETIVKEREAARIKEEAYRKRMAAEKQREEEERRRIEAERARRKEIKEAEEARRRAWTGIRLDVANEYKNRGSVWFGIILNPERTDTCPPTSDKDKWYGGQVFWDAEFGRGWAEKWHPDYQYDVLPFDVSAAPGHYLVHVSGVSATFEVTEGAKTLIFLNELGRIEVSSLPYVR